MRIGWIGGLDRRESALVDAARSAGHRLDFHKGDVRGRGAEELRALVARSDFVIILTDTNSHGAVQQARKAARHYDKPSLLVRNFGASRFQRLLDALDRRGTLEPALAEFNATDPQYQMLAS